MHADRRVAFPALRQAGIREGKLADAFRGWWAIAIRRREATDDELAAFVGWFAQRVGGEFNPAALWNPRNPDTWMRFQWHLMQWRNQRRAPTPTANDALRAWAAKLAAGGTL